MIEVHGTEAVTIARNNARMAAVARQPLQAKSWLRVVHLIQQQLAGKPALTARGGSSVVTATKGNRRDQSSIYR
jgi:hypothetical protein